MIVDNKIVKACSSECKYAILFQNVVDTGDLVKIMKEATKLFRELLSLPFKKDCSKKRDNIPENLKKRENDLLFKERRAPKPTSNNNGICHFTLDIENIFKEIKVHDQFVFLDEKLNKNKSKFVSRSNIENKVIMGFLILGIFNRSSLLGNSCR